MTRTEALEEARRRWGPEADVRLGVLVGQWINHVVCGPRGLMGNGKTWEAAFADADRREKEAKP